MDRQLSPYQQRRRKDARLAKITVRLSAVIVLVLVLVTIRLAG